MASNEPPIIIKKVKKGRPHAHYGGAWKVAYADFVTAMMAFFLLLWLLNATTEEQRKGIADYFSPNLVSNSESGANGVLGGRTIMTDGAMRSDSAPPNLIMEMPQFGEMVEQEIDPDALSEEAARLLAEQEETRFRDAEFALRQAIQDVPELNQLAENLIIDRTPEGMRIQIVDRERLSMFPLGSSEMLDHTKKLMTLVAEAIRRLPNKIAITGHTDSRPYVHKGGFSNWELSAERANASRRALIATGLPESRIASVIGKADEEPLITEDPTSPRNRRISIVLLHEAPDPVRQ
ncbi:flagellar motor protein MotB [Rhodospirillaceae bacterium SYSU D60014]|uniref:flagellar motor protein MotB n=1 Tax=Virgifigura deserti TaxID=2268457 RepID=UPI000E674024